MSDSKGDGNELLPVVVSSFSRLASDLPYDCCSLIFSPFSTINLNELRLVNRYGLCKFWLALTDSFVSAFSIRKDLVFLELES